MIQVKVPPLGESIVEATVSRWLKKEGEPVAAGDTLAELDTDKITVEVQAPKAGAISKIAAAEGAVVKVGDVLAEFDETVIGAAVGAPTAATGDRPPATGSEPVTGYQPPPTAETQKPAPPAPPPPASPPSGDGVKSSPAARRVADEAGIDVASVTGTGRGGVVSKPDVIERVETQPERSAASATPSAPSEANRETREKMSTRRKRIAENLLQSQHSTAHLTTFNEIDMSAVNALRDKMRERIEKEQGVKLTFMPLFVKAVCMALDTFPVINAQVDGEEIIYKHYVNMGIAVASDAGLVVPNIKDAHAKGIIQIGREISEVAKRAREGKLTMDDLTGGSFTITNGGVFGSLVSTPIINYPQVGILGLHKTQDRPVAIDGRVEIRPMMYVALSYDHRIVEGAHAVQFLVRVKELIEDPAAMLIS
ncbi:MAG: 2-oxoglutarate dehydrogenase complex dihydrolipoyllysine-residue succinyltransferase [Gemmatimonadaceae bacterium]